MLRVEINQIIGGLVEKHQVHRVVSTKLRPFIPISREPKVQTGESEDIAFKLSTLQTANRASHVS